MVKLDWTPEDRKTVIDAKRKNKHWNWDKVAATIEYRQSPYACRILFSNRNTIIRARRLLHKKVREESPPWSLQQRHRMAEMRNMEPPRDWEEISKDISKSIHDYHSPASCQLYYENLMPQKEKNSGASDAMSEAGIRKREDEGTHQCDKGTRQRDRALRRELGKTWTSKQWTLEDGIELAEMCTDRIVPWEEIAERLKRTVTSFKSKWYKMEPLYSAAFNEQSERKVVENRDKKGSSSDKIPKMKKNGEAGPSSRAASSACSSTPVGNPLFVAKQTP